jgi:hypothetical protein
MDEGGAVEHDGAVLVGDRRPQPADGLVLPHLEDLGLGGDLVARLDRSTEAPVDLEEDAAGAERSSATSALSSPEVTPPCTMIPPKRLAFASGSS